MNSSEEEIKSHSESKLSSFVHEFLFMKIEFVIRFKSIKAESWLSFFWYSFSNGDIPFETGILRYLKRNVWSVFGMRCSCDEHPSGCTIISTIIFFSWIFKCTMWQWWQVLICHSDFFFEIEWIFFSIFWRFLFSFWMKVNNNETW